MQQIFYSFLLRWDKASSPIGTQVSLVSKLLSEIIGAKPNDDSSLNPVFRREGTNATRKKIAASTE